LFRNLNPCLINVTGSHGQQFVKAAKNFRRKITSLNSLFLNILTYDNAVVVLLYSLMLRDVKGMRMTFRFFVVI